MDFGTQQQGAEAEVGERENDVEIFVHVTVMEKMMAVKAEENSGTLDVTLARQVHAPMHVFIGAVIDPDAEQRPASDTPAAGEKGKDGEWKSRAENQHRAVPPCHGNGFLVLFADQVIGMVRLENVMVNQGVALKWVSEFSERLVHDIAVQGPLTKGREDYGNEYSHCHPGEKYWDQIIIGLKVNLRC
jgi:hypothetical protein